MISRTESLLIGILLTVFFYESYVTPNIEEITYQNSLIGKNPYTIQIVDTKDTLFVKNK